MCLGVPGKVLSISGDGMSAQVDFFGVQKELRLDIVDVPVVVGDYVLNHVGSPSGASRPRRSARRWPSSTRS